MTLYISYSAVDLDLAAQLNAKLRANPDARLQSWLDRDRLAPADDWQNACRDALEASSGVIALLSASSLELTRTTAEWAWALAHGKPILALYLLRSISEERRIPPQFRDWNWTRWDATDDPSMTGLLARIAEIMEKAR